MQTRYLALLGFVAASMLAAQPISVGVKGGVPITDPFTTSGSSLLNQIGSGNRWTVGPTVELRLPWRLGVEVDAFYRPLEATAPNFAASATANSWTFPVLLKWRILPGPIQPFVGAGPVFDWVSGVNVNPGTLGFNVGSNNSVVRGGGTIAGGVEFHAGHVILSPELRFSRYSAENLGSNLGNLLNFNQNQATFLLGISFGPKR
jgi:hypothetical protein